MPYQAICTGSGGRDAGRMGLKKSVEQRVECWTRGDKNSRPRIHNSNKGQKGRSRTSNVDQLKPVETGCIADVVEHQSRCKESQINQNRQKKTKHKTCCLILGRKIQATIWCAWPHVDQAGSITRVRVSIDFNTWRCAASVRHCMVSLKENTRKKTTRHHFVYDIAAKQTPRRYFFCGAAGASVPRLWFISAEKQFGEPKCAHTPRQPLDEGWGSYQRVICMMPAESWWPGSDVAPVPPLLSFPRRRTCNRLPCTRTWHHLPSPSVSSSVITGRVNPWFSRVLGTLPVPLAFKSTKPGPATLRTIHALPLMS